MASKESVQKAAACINNILDMLVLEEGKEMNSETPLVMKKVDLEERRILGVVLEPEVYDLHKDIYSAEDVELACKCFEEHCMQPNLQHMVNLQNGAVTIEKSFIQPVDCQIGEQVVKAGSWLQQWKINDDDLWEAVKNGDFTGFSVGCLAVYEDIE